MVSIVVPAFNAEATVEECLDSLLRQTYPDFELIVVDDGSRDTTAELVAAKAAQDRRIRLLCQTNAGPGAARNAGIDHATGEWLCFVDSDDTVSPNYLEVLLSLFEPGVLPAVDVIRSDGAGSALSQIPEVYPIISDFPYAYFCGELGQGIAYSACNKLFQTELLRKKNIRFNEHAQIGEDMLFTFRYLCECCEVRLSRDAVYYYNVSEGSIVKSEKDYTQDYEMLIKVMRTLDFNGAPIDNKVLSDWSFEAVVFVVANPYIAEMKFHEFRVWWKKFSHTDLYLTSVQSAPASTAKRRLLQILLRSGAVLPLNVVLRSFDRSRRRNS